ncbi:response regulator [Erwiniaceae bacterium L1_54_6]|jgi:FixJ family two-component response regulator|uniref:Response regulator n=1 Tax=Pantoea cypripedii TaxID=55209 RepID=A0A6B9G267_PANCY|nr:response regulator [Pantoea cypripedii]MDF7658178.1 response regulator [Erwiniaceae bacterium L1_54_6]QGY29223.1 response regulator [Pantoea cypripedii]
MTLPQHIVIVDDERSVRNGLSNLLHSDGYTTSLYESGEELLQNESALSGAAMLIIDVRLKGMSGFELYSVLKQQSVALPVIFISADQEESVQWYAIALGAVTFLRKPIDVDTLLTIIRSELSRGETP